ncbi:MAG: pyridoxamine 5'-phosphate oxidase family protein [bacterium]
MPKRVLDDWSRIVSLLEETTVGVLATCTEGEPWAVPMNFVYDREANRVYLHSGLKGRKLDNIRVNPKVMFLVYDPGRLARADKACNFGQRYQSVILTGQARVVSDQEEKSLALAKLVKKYAAGHNVPPVPESEIDSVAIIVIEVEDISGKENVDPPVRDA